MHASEEAHIGKLLDLFPVHAVLKYPIAEDQMRSALLSTGKQAWSVGSGP